MLKRIGRCASFAWVTLIVLVASPAHVAGTAKPSASDTPAPQPTRAPLLPGRGNAVRVCSGARIGHDDQRLSPRKGKPELATNYYSVKSALPGEESSLDVVDGWVALSTASKGRPARRWLVTVVGADLYQISTCVNGAPRCLELAVGGELDGIARLAACDEEAMGTQAWWAVGRLFPKEVKGTYELGSDAVGRMKCLIVHRDGPLENVPKLEECIHTDLGSSWRLDVAGEAAAGHSR